MSPSPASPDKRLRICLLLDAYGELLTEKQRRFLRMYYEEDLSFGEIAQEYEVSRQAIFDSVKHGEEALEEFERVLGLVTGGWARLIQAGIGLERLQARVEDAWRAMGAEAGGKIDAEPLRAALIELREALNGDAAGSEAEASPLGPLERA